MLYFDVTLKLHQYTPLWWTSIEVDQVHPFKICFRGSELADQMGNHQSVYERQRQEDEARGREQARLAFAASQQRAAEEAARIARIAAEQEEERKRAQERLEKLQALNEHKKTLLDYTPTKPLTTNIFRGLDVSEITELRVGVFGMTGSGKSSFIKTCEVAINDDPRKFQAVIGTGGGEGTLILEDFLYECQSFRLLDTRGWAYNDMVETEEFYRICKGELLLGNECFRNRSNTTAPIPTSTSRTITDFNAIVSCILLVVKGNDPRLLTGAYKTTFQSYREFARRAGNFQTLTSISPSTRNHSDHDCDSHGPFHRQIQI